MFSAPITFILTRTYIALYSMSTPIQLIVGLANPGKDYAKTRHNIGAWFVEKLVTQQHKTWRFEKKFSANLAEISLANPCRLLIPQTYMNNSGSTVQAMVDYYQIPYSAILIVHDELDLAPGLARLRQGGGAAGHNGVKDVINQLKTANFLRLRIGIGRPALNQHSLIDYVLGRPAESETRAIESAIDASLEVMTLLSAGKTEAAMQQLHTHLII